MSSVVPAHRPRSPNPTRDARTAGPLGTTDSGPAVRGNSSSTISLRLSRRAVPRCRASNRKCSRLTDETGTPGAATVSARRKVNPWRRLEPLHRFPAGPVDRVASVVHQVVGCNGQHHNARTQQCRTSRTGSGPCTRISPGVPSRAVGTRPARCLRNRRRPLIAHEFATIRRLRKMTMPRRCTGWLFSRLAQGDNGSA